MQVRLHQLRLLVARLCSPWITQRRKTFIFSGRLARKEYWIYILQEFLSFHLTAYLLSFVPGRFSSIVFAVYFLFGLIPMFTTGVRRLRDSTGYGVSIFWVFVPCFGGFIWLWQTCSPTNGKWSLGWEGPRR